MSMHTYSYGGFSVGVEITRRQVALRLMGDGQEVGGLFLDSDSATKLAQELLVAAQVLAKQPQPPAAECPKDK